MTTAPIVLFVYNRLSHTKRTVDALKENPLANESSLFIFSDAAKDDSAQNEVTKVRNYLPTIQGFKSVKIIERSENWGLAKSIIDGVSKIICKYGSIIVLEDDLVTSPYFLKYMNDALEYYSDVPEVISIHGYNYPINDMPETFFIKGADCWGWATWKRGWDLFEPNGKKLLTDIEKRNLAGRFDFYGAYDYFQMLKDQIAGKNNSWAVRWYASALLADKLTLYPGRSLVRNIGCDDTGRHCSTTEIYNSEIQNIEITIGGFEVKEDKHSLKMISNWLKEKHPGTIQRVVRKGAKFLKSIIPWRN